MDKIIKIYKKYEEIIIYLIMGIFATIVNLGVKYALLFTILDAENPTELQIAVIISWISACLVAYVTNRIWVFKSESKRIIKEFVSFMIARILTLWLEMFIMFIFVTILGMNSDIWVVIWSLIAQIVVVISNYVFSKLFIFKKEKGANNEKN